MMNYLQFTARSLTVLMLLCYCSLQATAQQFSDTRGPKTADLYAFRSPDDTNTVTIIANFDPMQSPQNGMGYATFSENVRYEIHVENDGVAGDDITYRYTFTMVNEDPTTFFRVRLGQQNYKTTYLLEKSLNGGPFTTIVSNGTVPVPNLGQRSVSDPTVGLGASDYAALVNAAVVSASGGGGETAFCGHADDPFFMDLGGFSDLGVNRPLNPVDGFGRKNILSIAIQVPIATLQKNGEPVSMATSILDGNYAIGVWASVSQPETRTLTANGTIATSGAWIQTSRVGMPLVDDAIIPVGETNRWNALNPYTEDPAMDGFYTNPELGLYMDASLFGNAFPGWQALRIQRNSLQSFDFGNGQAGLYPIRATNGGAGTALDTNLFGNYLLRPNAPRSFDLLPTYYTGIPNLAPYHLLTGKNGNPLANGKPFVNNFLPTFGDMLRLNMAVPVTPRNHPQFSSDGLLQASLLGITTAPYNQNANLEWIPNMDGFPNGRRLEDDVLRITMQLHSGMLMANVGLLYDDYVFGNPITTDYTDVMTFTTGIEANDTTFKPAFPFLQNPWVGTGSYGSATIHYGDTIVSTITDTVTILISVTDTLFIDAPLALNPPDNMNTIRVYPNPSSDHVYIDNGNYAIMTGYSIRITNTLSQTVFDSPIDQQLFYIDVTTWSGNGIYYVELRDSNGDITDTRKIVIQ